MHSTSFQEHFGELPDPRIEQQKRHSLMEILFIFPMNRDAVICRARLPSPRQSIIAAAF